MQLYEFDMEHKELLVLYPEQWEETVMHLIDTGKSKRGYYGKISKEICKNI